MYISYYIQVAKTKDAEDADGQGDCTLREHRGNGGCSVHTSTAVRVALLSMEGGGKKMASLHFHTASPPDYPGFKSQRVIFESRVWEKLLKQT